MQVTQSDIQQLYQQYGPLVYRRCRALVGDEHEAWDLMQEAFVKLVQHRETLRGEASPLTWLYKVTTHLCLNRIRDARARARKLAAPDPAAVLPPGMSGFKQVSPEDAQLLRSLLASTDEETRAIVLCYFEHDMTLEEIGGIVGLSVPTVRKRLTTFQASARQALEPGGALLMVYCLHQVLDGLHEALDMLASWS